MFREKYNYMTQIENITKFWYKTKKMTERDAKNNIRRHVINYLHDILGTRM